MLFIDALNDSSYSNDNSFAYLGGSLKIYGTELSPSKPYVTLLVSVRDRADKIVKETLEKYGLERHDPSDFCLAEVILPHSENEYKSESVGQLTPIGERFLEDDDCPLMLLANRPANVTENIIFQVRRRPDSMSRPRRRHLSSSSASAVRVVSPGNRAMDPCLVELSADGTDVPGNPRVFRVLPNVTELGSDRALTQMGVQSFPLQGPYVHPRHCVLAFMDGVVTLTPCTPTAEIEINGQPIVQTTILRDRFVIRIGRSHVFRFFEHGAQGAPFASVPRSQSQPFNDQKGDDNNERRTLTIDSGRRSVGRDSSNVSVEHVDSHTWPRRNGPADSTSPTHKEPKLVAIQLETTFDVDGTIETCALSPGLQGGCDVKEIVSSDRLFAASPAPQLRPHPTARDSIPAIVELLDNVEDEFLYAVIRDVDPERQQFKLSPVYVLYMACRYRLSPHYRTSLLAEERAAMLANFLAKTTNMLHVTIQDHCHSTDALAFWMANSSELLNLVKLDRVIGPVTNPEPQESLADAVEKAFGHLTSCLREELQAAMPAVLDPSLDDSSAAGPCLHMLASAMKLLRYCRLNAALTIQLFSQLFHFINMYLFNWLVSIEGSSYCSRAWGQRLAARIGRIQEWAEKQGLELAAECHLDRIVQAVKLLQTPKTMDQLATLGATCYKLNSLQ
uniref:Ras-associating domain-containing protein n=1 Tax=Plectus sambesii TaxID=2011161 RepID=A0A914W9W0_9BILA